MEAAAVARAGQRMRPAVPGRHQRENGIAKGELQASDYLVAGWPSGIRRGAGPVPKEESGIFPYDQCALGMGTK